ncbi:MAG: endonuclease domain-containing protein [Terriglobia bacterium]
MANGNSHPSPLWGRGWLASGVLISRGETGEGVGTVSSPHPYRKTRSLARTAGRIDKARALRRSSTEAEQAAWHLLRTLRLKGFRFRRQHRVGPYIADFLLPGASPDCRA